jgi:hypothetical protein
METTAGQVACQAWADAHGNPISFKTWENMPQAVRDKWEEVARAVLDWAWEPGKDGA